MVFAMKEHSNFFVWGGGGGKQKICPYMPGCPPSQENSEV